MLAFHKTPYVKLTIGLFLLFVFLMALSTILSFMETYQATVNLLFIGGLTVVVGATTMEIGAILRQTERSIWVLIIAAIGVIVTFFSV
ncbi:hypothetical protein [Exiguobacterium sp.]|uniref:hypothetical protein n=1 Tax=Exiguobacterium sp. TaxID=44751 RepID=UPI00391B3CEA